MFEENKPTIPGTSFISWWIARIRRI